MCGIFGIISEEGKTIKDVLTKKQFNDLIKHAERRGKDSSGYVDLTSEKINIIKMETFNRFIKS